jgi:hypothetical protein
VVDFSSKRKILELAINKEEVLSSKRGRFLQFVKKPFILKKNL